MIIDTSALIAILSDEPERRCFTEALCYAACMDKAELKSSLYVTSKITGRFRSVD